MLNTFKEIMRSETIGKSSPLYEYWGSNLEDDKIYQSLSEKYRLAKKKQYSSGIERKIYEYWKYIKSNDNKQDIYGDSPLIRKITKNDEYLLKIFYHKYK